MMAKIVFNKEVYRINASFLIVLQETAQKRNRDEGSPNVFCCLPLVVGWLYVSLTWLEGHVLVISL